MRRLLGGLSLMLFLVLPLLRLGEAHCVSHGDAAGSVAVAHEAAHHPAPEELPADCTHCPPADCALAEPCANGIPGLVVGQEPGIEVAVEMVATPIHTGRLASRALEPGLPPPRALILG